MASLILRVKQKGFTLVELLIVVAIIGVLATIGIPSFRRMVQKSKKAEAKVSLGSLYTAESAFLAEYNAYGNNLAQMNIQTEGAPSTLTYVFGFVDNACASLVTSTVTTIFPDKATPGSLGDAINIAQPTYYSGAKSAKLGNTALAGAGCTPPTLTTLYGTGAVPNVYTATGDSDRFVAIASGVIAPGISKTAPAAADTDVWGINDGRILSNLQDGVK